MRVLIQRVSRGSVVVEGETISSIRSGLVLLVGISHDDTESECQEMARKVVNLRLFEDKNGAMNLSALDLAELSSGSAEMLVISQFTLYADCRKGRRPSFTEAARPELAESLVDRFVQDLEAFGIDVSTGRFGAMMDVDLVNRGPVTIWLDSQELKRSRSSDSAPGT